MKKILILAVILALVGCATVPQIPEFAKEVNGLVWLQMPPQVQAVFLFGFACGQCEMAIWLNEPEEWDRLVEVNLLFAEIAQAITRYYLTTGRLEDSVLLVHRFIMSISEEAEPEPVLPGGI